MKNTILTSFFVFCFLNYGYSQTYDFINQNINSSKEKHIYLKDRFITDYRVEVKFFDEINFSEWWSPFPNSQTPSIKLFFDNFNLLHLKAELETNKTDSVIDFKKLNKKFYKSSNQDLQQYGERSYLSISKPIFNCSKNWCLIIKSYYTPQGNAGGDGNIFIYRKVGNKWIFYHKFSLWMS